MHQKCFNYALTNLLFSSCRSKWVIEFLVTFRSPHPGVPTHPFTPKVLWAREFAPILYPFIVCTFRLAIELLRSLGCVAWHQSFDRTWSTYWGILMAPKRTHKLVQMWVWKYVTLHIHIFFGHFKHMLWSVSMKTILGPK
jgi:hypothetical protein